MRFAGRLSGPVSRSQPCRDFASIAFWGNFPNSGAGKYALLRIAFSGPGMLLWRGNLNNINHTMNPQIMTGDRYIAIPYPGGEFAFRGVYRILCKDGTVHPSKWNAANKRLESCSLNAPGIAVPMHHASQRLKDQLARAGITFRFLTLEDAAN